MPRAPQSDSVPGRVITQNGQGPSSHATEVMTRKLGPSQDETITRDLDSTSTTSTTHSSKETLPSPPTPVTVFPLFRLPPELRDEIYVYASMTEKVWIGRLPRLDHTPDDVIVEKKSMYKPATLIRTEHSIVSVCHETRAEFRTAVWREYMTEPRVVRFRV